MTARNYTILSGSATPIQEFALPRDVFIVNEDVNNTVYLDTNRGVQSTSGMPLPPQSTKRWIAGDPCFAITSPGQTATLNVSDNAGELNNPSAVATQILNQGLAAQIAAAITLSGVPLVDAPAELSNFSQSVVSTNTPVNTGILDVSRYQSLNFSTLEINAGTPGIVGCRPWTIQWFADAAGTIVLDIDTFMTPLCTGGFVNVSVPCKGAFFRLSASDAVTTTNATLTIVVYGSYRPRSRQRYRFIPSSLSNTSGGITQFDTGDNGAFTMQVSPGAGVVVTEYPYTYAGPAMLHVLQTTTSAGTVKPQIQVSHMNDGRRICWDTIPIGQFGTINVPLYLPREPVIVSINNAATNANTFTVSLSMDGYAT